MRRIAFGITDLDVGGAERAFVALLTRLDRSRWRPSVVCLEPPGPLREPLALAGIEVESLEMRSVADVPRGIRDWTKFLRSQEPVALVTFLFHANLLGRLAAQRSGVGTHVSSVRVAERGRRWHLWMDRLTTGWTDHYVCVSQGVASFTKNAIGATESRITVIPNGVDLSAADDAAEVDLETEGISPEGPVLVFLGRLERQKRPDLIVRAVATIREAAEANHLRVLFVGQGAMRSELERQIEDAHLGWCFRFVGATQNPFGWIKGAGGLVLPSDWEGMPNVVLEAMACGRAVIASDVPGVCEIVADGKTGWLFPAGDAETLGQKILEWMQSAELRESMGRAGRRRVEEEFRIERTVERWERLLERLLPKNDPSAAR